MKRGQDLYERYRRHPGDQGVLGAAGNEGAGMSDLNEDQKNSLRGHGLLDDGVPYVPLADSHELPPGSTCPSCSRRIPHPKKSTSPTTRPLAYRIPLDEADAHLEVLDAVAELLGISEEKFHRFKTISYCAAAVLQGARLEEDGG